MQKQENKFDCGLFPIVSRTQQLEEAPILIDDENDFWGVQKDSTPTAEFPRAEPLQPWSPYMTYPEQRALRVQRKNRESWKALAVFVVEAIVIGLGFAALFILS